MSVDSRSINIDLCGLVYIKTNIWIKIAGAIITVKSEAVTMTKVYLTIIVKQILQSSSLVGTVTTIKYGDAI